MDTLHDQHGNRLYLNSHERESFLSASTGEKREIKAFCHVLTLTGCRVSEGLQLTPRRVDFSEKTLTFRTLKQRREKPVFRNVPVPDNLLEMLGDVYAIRSGVQLHMLSKWLGHAKMENTAIYAQALGEEEREIAARMWG